MNRVGVSAGARRWRALVGPLIAGMALIASANASALTITISGSPPATVTTGSKYSFTPTAKTSNGSKPNFSITGKTGWATFSTTTGQLTGTPTVAGKWTGIGIHAYEGTTTSNMIWFGITATSGGVITLSGTPPKTATVGQAYSFKPTATDSAGKALSFSVQNKPAWAS